MRRLLTLGLVAALTGCAHNAGTQGPPAALADQQPIYTTQTTFGPCTGQPEAGLVSTLAAAVITKGVNRIGKAIAAAAAAETTTVLARRNIEISNLGTVGPCVFVARGWFYPGPPTYPSDGHPGSLFHVTRGTQFPYGNTEKATLWRRGLYLAATPDFYFEGAVGRSGDGGAYTVAPRTAWLAEPLRSSPLRTEVRNVLVSFALVPLDKPTTLDKGGSTVVLGALEPGVLRRFSAPACSVRLRSTQDQVTTQTCEGDPTASDYTIVRSPFESEWFGVALTPERRPMTLLALVSETRDASAFLGFVAEVFSASEGAIATELQNELIPESRERAEEADLAAEELLRTNYDKAWSTAFTAFTACVSTPAAADKRIAARIALRDFVAAARRAEIGVATLSSLVISPSGTTADECQGALTALSSLPAA